MFSIAAEQDLPRPDPGLARLAVANLSGLSTMPFAGGYERYSGYGAPRDGLFPGLYRAALTHGIPSSFLAARPWIAEFAGPGTPNQIFRFKGHVVLQQRFCQAHNCGGNEVYILYTPNTRHVWGVVTSFRGPAYAFGLPTADEASLLLILLAQSAVAYSVHTDMDTFPLAPKIATRVKQHIMKANGDYTAAAADSLTEAMR